VMFIREFVPQRLVAWVARTIYNEPYQATPMHSRVEMHDGAIVIEHEFTAGGRVNLIRAIGDLATTCPADTSDEHFFKEHRWGFGRARRGGRCITYEVIHPTWECHAVREWKLDLDWRSVYGEEWAILQDAQPCSVLIAKGSRVSVLPKRATQDRSVERKDRNETETAKKTK
jgi:hypothetical protein